MATERTVSGIIRAVTRTVSKADFPRLEAKAQGLGVNVSVHHEVHHEVEPKADEHRGITVVLTGDIEKVDQLAM